MKLIGYIITSDREEFVGGIHDRGYYQVIEWVRYPNDAKVYSSIEQIQHSIKKAGFSYPVYPVEIYEDETRYLVTANNRKTPHWLKSRTPQNVTQ